MTRRLLTFCVIAAFLITPTHAGWLRGEKGNVPTNAVVAGESGDQQPFYICRAQYNGGVHPGMLLGTSGYCSISYNGGEYQLPDFEVLVENSYSWVSGLSGGIPFDALLAGQDQQGNILFVCRGEVNSEIRPGKIRQTDDGCKVPHAGKEETAYWYEVLVGN